MVVAQGLMRATGLFETMFVQSSAEPLAAGVVRSGKGVAEEVGSGRGNLCIGVAVVELESSAADPGLGSLCIVAEVGLLQNL